MDISAQNELIIKQNTQIITMLSHLAALFTPTDEQVDDIIYEEPTTAFEAINIANHALATLTLIDEDDSRLTDSGKQAIQRIKRKSMKLLDWGVNEAYDGVFDETK